MDEPRTETAPTLLMLLAACALGFSGYAAVRLVPKPEHGPAAARSRPEQKPRRQLRWPVDRLDELAQVELEDLVVERLPEIASVLEVAPPALQAGPGLAPYATVGWPARFFPPEAIDAAFAEPIDPPPMLVLLPAPARLSAAKTPVREPDAWRLFGFDSLDAAEAVGRRWGSMPVAGGEVVRSLTELPRFFGSGERVIREAKREESGPILRKAEQAAPDRRLAQRSSRRRLAASLISTVSPSSSALLSLPSIERYLIAGAEGGVFPTPTQIGQQLSRLSESPLASGWAWAVAYRLRGVVGSGPNDETAVRRALAALQRASDEAATLAEQSGDEPIATELRRARYALDRRVATWSAVLRNQASQTAEAQRLRRQDWLLGARWAMTPEGWNSWSGLAAGDGAAEAPIRLAKRLERYEAAPSGARARTIAVEAARLAQSGDDTGLQIASAIQEHYRNANLRVAVAADLIERLLPKSEPKTSVIRDRIAGAPVNGRSTTDAQLTLVPVPTDDAWRLALRADGVVRSQTVSRGGPAVLKSRGTTTFSAEKSIFIDNRGFWAHPATAQTTGSTARLASVSTRYDGVPLLGSYARSSARRQYEIKKRRAGAEVRSKVERRVSSELDTRAETALKNLHRRYVNDVVGRLGRLNLNAEPVEMRTTETRLIGRLRIAGDRQLAAHTPRMRAPSDSVLSVQLHESTLNNAIEGLELAGAKMTVEDLRDRIAAKLDFEPNGQIDGESARTMIRFAAVDPIRVAFEDGRARLTLAIDELAVRGKRHRGFKVHTLYRPSTEGLRAVLVQEGTAQIEGRMRSTTRLRLHAALGKVLGEDRRIPLTPSLETLRPDVAMRLKGLTTTQLVIEDGWMGIAVAPERHAGRVAARVGGYVR